jgi:hypothetical protein
VTNYVSVDGPVGSHWPARRPDRLSRVPFTLSWRAGTHNAPAGAPRARVSGLDIRSLRRSAGPSAAGATGAT